MPYVPFSRQSTPGESLASYSGERLVNMFARAASSPWGMILAGRSGLVEHVQQGKATIAAMTQMGGAIYFVSRGHLYKMDGASVSTVGTVADGVTYMVSSANQIAIVVAGLYFVSDGETVSEVTPGVIIDPIGVEFMDGYFIVIGSDGNRDDALQVSGLYDAATFDDLEFAFAEENSDALVGIIRDHGELYLLGTKTVQPFYNSGDLAFPFSPNRGAVSEQGCLNGATIAKADNAVFWVRPDRAVVRNPGATPQVISTPEIQEELTGSTITGGFTFSDRGSEFYAITRDDKSTLVFDIRAGLWHERTSGLEYEPWAARCVERFEGVQYFGCTNGQIATQSEDAFEDFGEVLLAEAISPPIDQGGALFIPSRLLVVAAGGGTLDRAPIAVLQTSEDGLAWSREHPRIMGSLGRRRRTAEWRALGQFDSFQARIRITDPVPRDIYGVSYA